MDFFFRYKDKNDNIISSGGATLYLNEAAFRECRRKEMKKMPNVYYCEYYKLNVPRTKVKTIANL